MQNAEPRDFQDDLVMPEAFASFDRAKVSDDVELAAAHACQPAVSEVIPQMVLTQSRAHTSFRRYRFLSKLRNP
jgi:hypothetical protein